MAAGATPPCDKSDAKVTWLFLNEVIAVFYSDPVIEYHNANVSDCLESHSPLSCGSCHLHLLLLDICLLDDPFRTVDAHTRTHLFQVRSADDYFYEMSYYGALAYDKMVVYATHHLELLEAAALIFCTRRWKNNRVKSVQ
ncbi:uncharacterized protein LOC130710946 isoform X3 [Lotus japonicus]|uniref:uncharacterized protein LOC130710946 isoform X3 n=1 Tax=Lotus japonicus TaxID=34305 RepID=UPI0025832E5D|nr:uncharacterized protein LOC130710946 isoform X3 [Lotus japonicus]